MSYQLFHGDCLEIMPTLEAGSVDAIITDLPYGTTACSWDTIIPFVPMWEAVKRVLKPRGVFLTTASQPFTSALVMSNLKWFKYEWIWKKNATGYLNAKLMPMKSIENVPVFYSGVPTYNPENLRKVRRVKANGKSKGLRSYKGIAVHNGGRLKGNFIQEYENYPNQVLEFKNDINTNHPTQKPVALYEYLIKTYTNPGETVLDMCMGSGTTGEAALKTGRNFIGIELMPQKPDDPDYFGIATARIEDTARLMRKEFKPLKDNRKGYEDLPMFAEGKP